MQEINKISYSIMIILVFGLFLLSTISALPQPTIQDNSHWELIEDNEPGFYPEIFNKNIHKTTICFVSETATKLKDLRDYEFFINSLEDNKIKPKKIDNERFGYCYDIKDGERKIKFGNNSIVYEWINNTYYIYDTDLYDKEGFEIEIYINNSKVITPDISFIETEQQSDYVEFFPNISGISYPLNEITFKVNTFRINKEIGGSFFIKERNDWELKFDTFESKNNITSKNIIENNPSLLSCILRENLIFVSEIRDCLREVESYDVTYYGEIVDLDPELELVYSSASQIEIIGNQSWQTIADNLGVHLTKNATTFNVSKGDFKSLIFYNSTSTYWNTTLGIDVKNIANTSTTNVNANITLQTRTADSYNLSDPTLSNLWALNGDGTDEANHNDGSVSGVTFGDSYGIVDEGGYFNGNDYVTISTDDYLLLGKDQWTWAAWVYSSDWDDADHLQDFFSENKAGGGTYWVLDIRTYYGTPSIWLVDDDGTPSIVPAASFSFENGKWYHMTAMKVNNSYHALYVNGVMADNDNKTTTWNTNPGHDVSYIGRYATRYMNGNMDDIRIYNRSLSDEEIVDLYELGQTHIEWNAWKDEGLMTDNIPETSTDEGKFFQFKSVFETNDTLISPYVLNYSIEAGVQYTIQDDEYPIFSDYDDSSSTNTTQDAIFNVSILSTNGTVFLEIDGTNYTASNDTATLFNVTLSAGILGEGVYDYYWNAWGNGSLNNYNVSETQSYIVSDIHICPNSWIGNGNIVSPCQVTECNFISTDHLIYELQNDITGIEGNCFNITSTNSTLNFNGFSITGDNTGSGIFADAYGDLTVKSGLIMNFNRGISLINNAGVNITDMNLVDNRDVGLFLNASNTNSFYNLNTSLNDNSGIYLTESEQNKFEDIESDRSIYYAGIYLGLDSRENVFVNISTSNGNDGIYIDSASNNTLVNLNSYSSGNIEINYISGEGNKIVYNNSFGEIKLLKQLNYSVNGELTFPGNILITNNSAYWNKVIFAGEGINGSANITLQRIGDRGYTVPSILKDGESCGGKCYNFTSLVASTVIFNVTEAGNYSIGESTLQNTSLLGVKFVLPEFTFSSTTYTKDGSFSFNTSTYNKSVILMTSFNVKNAVGGTGDVTLWGNVTIDGKQVHEEELVNIEWSGGSTDIASTGFQQINFTLAEPGIHNVSFWFKEVSGNNKPITIYNSDISLGELYTNASNRVDGAVLDFSANFNSTTFVNIANFTLNRSVEAEDYHTLKFNMNSSASTIIKCRIAENDKYSPYSMTTLGGGESKSDMILSFIDKEVQGSHNVSLECLSTTGEGITIDGRFIEFALKDRGGYYINNFQASNPLTNLTNNITLNAGTHTITNGSLFFGDNGDSIFLTAHTSFSSTSGSQTPTFYLNGTLDTLNCSSQKEKSSNGDIADVYFHVICKNSPSQGEIHNISLIVEVPAGETIAIFDESLNGFEVQSFNILTLNTAPTVAILTPDNNDNVSGNVQINASISDLQGDTWLSTIYADNGTYYSAIGTNVQSDNLSLYWNTAGLMNGQWEISWNATENETADFLVGRDSVLVNLKNKPLLNIESPESKTYDDTIIDFNISLVSYSTNISSCVYSINDFSSNQTMTRVNDTFFTFTEDVNFDGVYTANFSCNNSENEFNSSESITFTVDVGSEIDFLYPENTTYTSQVTEINYTYDDKECGGLVYCEYSLDGGLTNNSMTCGENVTGITSQEGSNTWGIFIYTDCFGDDSDYRTFYVDLPPNVTINSPLTGSTQDLVFNFTMNTTDMGGVDTQIYNWRGINYTYTSTATLYAFAGIWSITAWANDSTGTWASVVSTFTTRDLDTDTDTNATTECPDGYYLDGSGSCILVPTCNSSAKLSYDGSAWSCITDLNTGTATTTSTCKKIYYINDGYYPFGKLGCAIEFI